MFVRPSAFVDLENGWSTGPDPLETAFLPREHRLLETVHSWVAGFLPWVAILLFLFGFIPFTVLVFSLLSVLCLLACLRTLALSALVTRLQRMHGSSSSLAGSSSSGALEAGATAGGDGLLMLGGSGAGASTTFGNLLNFRLSMLDRDFGSSDYDLLLRLDAAGRGGGGPHRSPVNEALLAALPTYQHRGCNSSCKGGSASSAKVGSGGSAQSSDADVPTCSVCLERYREGATLTALPCAHSFHRPCINKWLRQQGANATCPICKSRVFGLPEGPV